MAFGTGLEYCSSVNIVEQQERPKQPISKKACAFLKKVADVAYKILGYVPVTGTIIGAHHAYKAMNSEAALSNMQKFKIVAQIFSFLIVPQIAYGIARGVEALKTHLNSSSRSNEFELQEMTNKESI